ncbi:hypothetical protein [Anaerobranca gottschalkii]|uniref:Uncharacterized protein n=1 Tax=Anaerobranca gottschalkii DSM 13577 TaxID=1120990 RepID=A0A1H9ZUE6_9FIRM|nr:hypothetical protein [Anaerobranca gottschalkii]SES85333.1 hypothetical protein SAMN03080614_101328 [Anaerobranca gottschalkii DSM 13577]
MELLARILPKALKEMWMNLLELLLVNILGVTIILLFITTYFFFPLLSLVLFLLVISPLFLTLYNGVNALYTGDKLTFGFKEGIRKWKMGIKYGIFSAIIPLLIYVNLTFYQSFDLSWWSVALSIFWIYVFVGYIMLQFYLPCVLVDTHLSFFQSLKYSAILVIGNFGYTFGWILLLGLFLLLLFLVNNVVTLNIVFFAFLGIGIALQTRAYLTLKERQGLESAEKKE